MNKKNIGQLFLVGYMGEQPSDEFLSFVNEWNIGGVIVFARNLSDPEKLPKYLKQIEEAAENKLFTAIDQEGGLVLRILNKGSLFPSAMGISSTNDPDLCEQIYKAIGTEMKNFGLNWNLAPVLDINHKDNPGIGARSFGETPQKVAEMGLRAIKGLQSAGVLACAKHFPGKGHAKVDSHLTLPIIPYSAERLENFELFPFKKAIENGVDAIMTSHVFFPAFESTDKLPVTLSENVLTGLLREKYSYNGIIVTDDLEMGAITESFGIENAADMAFHAGADLLLICHTLEKQRTAAELLLQKSNRSEKTVRRINESLNRIKAAKNRISDSKPLETPWECLVNNHKPLIEEAYEKSIKFLKYSNNMIPIIKTDKIMFVLPKISALVKVEEEHEAEGIAKLFKQYFPSASCCVYEPNSTEADIIKVVSINSDKDTKVVFCSYNSHIFPGQTNAIKRLKAYYENLALIALRNPYDIFEHPEIKTSAATFGFRTPAIKAVLEVLSGNAKPRLSPWPINS